MTVPIGGLNFDRLLALLERCADALERCAEANEAHLLHVQEVAPLNERLQLAAVEGWGNFNARPEVAPVTLDVRQLVVELLAEFDRRRT